MVVFSPHPLQRSLLVEFLVMAVLTGVKVVPHCSLIHISVIIIDIEHLFICLFAKCMSSLEKCLFRPSAHFSIELCFVVVALYEVFVYFGN